MTPKEMIKHPAIHALVKQARQAPQNMPSGVPFLTRDQDAVIVWRIRHDHDGPKGCPKSPRLTGAPGDYDRMVMHLAFPE